MYGMYDPPRRGVECSSLQVIILTEGSIICVSLMCIFIKLHMAAQFGPIIYHILHSTIYGGGRLTAR